jgi:putative flippase GtrA
MLHWLCFAGLWQLTRSQALSNLLAFTLAATVSFRLNAKFTFRMRGSVRRYILFLAGMALISGLAGLAGDIFALRPLVTLIVSSGTSLGLGFLYAYACVFRKGGRDAPDD